MRTWFQILPGLVLFAAATTLWPGVPGHLQPLQQCVAALGQNPNHEQKNAPVAPDRNRPSYAGTWALWDAEGQYLTTAEIVDIHDRFGAGILFFRSETKHDLDFKRLKNAGLALIKVAHPGYAPFKDATFLDDELRVREWARTAAGNPFIDGIALDIEGPTATTHKNLFRVLAEEAHARNKTFHAVPHFALFNRWEGTLTPQEINTYADVVWPWLYNRFRQPNYGQGLVSMLAYWRDKGVTVPTYPIFDHGRTDYSGIAPSEAREVPSILKKAGVETVCLFQPHVSYRSLTESEDYAALWRNLAKAYGNKGDDVVERIGE